MRKGLSAELELDTARTTDEHGQCLDLDFVGCLAPETVRLGRTVELMSNGSGLPLHMTRQMQTLGWKVID